MIQRPKAVVLIGLILITTSFWLLAHLPSYSLYRQINHEWPESIIQIRFIGSYLIRGIGLVSGGGLLLFNNTFRKFLIGLSYYSLCTLPLRHTYDSQLFFSEPIYRQYGSMMSLEVFTWTAVIGHWMVDGIFSGLVIFYLTRPKVKAAFQTKDGR